MPCDRACARARPGENAPTHGRQFFRTNVLVRPSSYSSSFPFSSSLFFRFLLLIPRFLSAFTPCSPALHHSRPARAVRTLVACKRQPSPIFRLFSRMFTRAGKKRFPSLSAMSFLSGIRGILTRTISRARARDVQKANRVLKLSRTTGRTNSESQVGPKSDRI